ncbi:MAG: type IV pilus twitching motility protein PilT [Candidatus Polarisedimenticolia bacterium]
MSPIDAYLRLAQQLKAERLSLSAGEKAAVVTSGSSRPLTPQPLNATQVLDLVKDLLPGKKVPVDGNGREHVFTHRTQFGAFVGKLRFEAGLPRVEISPAPDGTPPVPSAIEEAPAQAAAPRPAATTSPAAVAAPSTGIRGEMDALMRRLTEERCSDLHLSTGNPPLFRRDGRIEKAGPDVAMSAERVRDMVYSICPPRELARFEETHDLDFAYEIPEVARFRCNLYLDRHGVGGVFRVIPAAIPNVEVLGLSRHVMDLCALNKGLVLVTGPTGSGKSTTLAAMIDHINGTRDAHIITIEDPIEFVHENRKCLVNQREVGRHTASFKAALRAALREDPDIVLVGELRDLETMAIAMETAETGHLVFGTLHTNSAPSTVERIVDQFPTDRHEQVRVMLSESLRGVITQTLCRRRTGGRVAAYEVLLVNPAVANLIREGKTFQIPSIMQTGKSLGMMTLNDALFDLVKRKLIEPAEAYHHALAKAELKAMIEKGGLGLKVETATA